MPRFAYPMLQEDKSGVQLKERFIDLHWKLDAIPRDLGEDYLAQIYEQGESTGLIFHVQLKSCTDIDKFKRKRLKRYSYTFDVADIIHWEVSVLPTLLLIWDVNRRSGVWVFVSDAIDQMNKEREGWRQNKTVEVIIPFGQDTTDEGFAVLRAKLLEQNFDSLKRWFLQKINIKFPNSVDSEADLQRFIEAKRTGESVELGAQYIQFEERDRRLLGPLLDWNWKVTMGSRPSDEVFPARFILDDSDGKRTEIPYVELRLIKKGDEIITFSNAHKEAFGVAERKASLLAISLTQNLIDDSGIQFKFSNDNTAPTPSELLQGIDFVNAFALGGVLTIEYLRVSSSQSESIPPGLIRTVSPYYRQYIEILALLEQCAQVKFRLPDWKLAQNDFENIDFALALYATGKSFSFNNDHKIPLNSSLLKDSSERLEEFLSNLIKTDFWVTLVSDPQEQQVSILGINVPLGTCKVKIIGRVGWDERELESRITSSKEEYLLVPIVDCMTVTERISLEVTEEQQ